MEGLISVILKNHIIQIVFLPKPRFFTIVQITPNDPENSHALGQIIWKLNVKQYIHSPVIRSNRTDKTEFEIRPEALSRSSGFPSPKAVFRLLCRT